MTLSRQNLLGVGLAAAILTAVALAVANFAGESENGGAGPYAITLVVSLAIAAILFGWAIPRTERPGRVGLVVGLLGLLAVAVFWTGLPYVLGPAAVALGLRGRAQVEGKGTATAAVVLGALATVGAIAAVVIDQAT
jgi:hypothetical protein